MFLSCLFLVCWSWDGLRVCVRPLRPSKLLRWENTMKSAPRLYFIQNHQQKQFHFYVRWLSKCGAMMSFPEVVIFVNRCLLMFFVSSSRCWLSPEEKQKGGFLCAPAGRRFSKTTNSGASFLAYLYLNKLNAILIFILCCNYHVWTRPISPASTTSPSTSLTWSMSKKIYHA